MIGSIAGYNNFDPSKMTPQMVVATTYNTSATTALSITGSGIITSISHALILGGSGGGYTVDGVLSIVADGVTLLGATGVAWGQQGGTDTGSGSTNSIGSDAMPCYIPFSSSITISHYTTNASFGSRVYIGYLLY